MLIATRLLLLEGRSLGLSSIALGAEAGCQSGLGS
jgi:hypothetical protein